MRIQFLLEAVEEYGNAITLGDYSKSFSDCIDEDKLNSFKEGRRRLDNKLDNIIKLAKI